MLIIKKKSNYKFHGRLKNKSFIKLKLGLNKNYYIFKNIMDLFYYSVLVFFICPSVILLPNDFVKKWKSN